MRFSWRFPQFPSLRLRDRCVFIGILVFSFILLKTSPVFASCPSDVVFCTDSLGGGYGQGYYEWFYYNQWFYYSQASYYGQGGYYGQGYYQGGYYGQGYYQGYYQAYYQAAYVPPPASSAGTFYADPDGTSSYDIATNRCLPGGTTPQSMTDPGTSIAATNTGGTYPGIIAGSTYTISNVPAYPTTSITLTLDPNLWTCTCPVGCTFNGITPGATSQDVHFYVTQARAAWFQTQNGLLYAGNPSGTVVSTQIPSSCNGACIPALSLQNAAKTVNSSGITFTGGGSIDTTSAPSTTLTYLSEDARSDRVLGATENGPREDYQYFYTQLYSMGDTPASDFTGAKPGAAPANGRAYYASGDVTISNPWTLAATDSMVFFVNGNLTISNNITVPNGAFLAFIVKGNITVANTVGQAVPTSTTSVVDGIYYADGTFMVQGGRVGGDLKFVGSGSFIGRQGVALGRDYTPKTTNNTSPVDLFQFRPDLIANAPARMLKPLVVWQEVAN